MRTPLLAAIVALAVAGTAWAQDPPPAPAPAPEPAPAPPAPEPAPAPPAPAPAPAEADFSGDWEWSGQMQDQQISGTFRINRNSETGRYSGVVSMQNSSGGANSPIRNFTVRGRSFTLTAEFRSEIWTFQGRLEGNAGRSANGTINSRGGMGRLRAEKRS